MEGSNTPVLSVEPFSFQQFILIETVFPYIWTLGQLNERIVGMRVHPVEPHLF